MNNADFNEFEMIINDIITNKQVLKMKNYRQHCDTNTYDHCYNAAKYCYKICKKLNLDYKSATRAAMLHDFFYTIGELVERLENINLFMHLFMEKLHMKMHLNYFCLMKKKKIL